MQRTALSEFARSLALVALMLSGAGSAVAQQTRIELRIQPAIDLWTSARAHAYSPDGAPEELAPLVGAMHALSKHVSRGWGFLEGGLNGATSTQDIVDQLGSVDKARTRGGEEVDISAEVQAVMKALLQVEPVHREKLWPARLAVLQEKHKYLETTLLPKQAQAFAYMLRSLGMDDPGIVVPVYLVSHSPRPGATTYYDQDRNGFSIVSVDLETIQGTALAETVLHEATHALDMASNRVSEDRVSEKNVLAKLRDRLRDAGLGFRDPAFRDLPHTLMFAQAGETIRRFVDPDHVHYGSGPSTYYQRVQHGEMERDLWIRHLDGEVSLDQVLDRLVATTGKVPAGKVPEKGPGTSP